MKLSSGQIFLHLSQQKLVLVLWTIFIQMNVGKNRQLILFIRYKYQHKCVECVHEVYVYCTKNCGEREAMRGVCL